jgi:lysophospholipase L1-like esterase
MFYRCSSLATVFFALAGLAGAQNPAIVPTDRLGEPWWTQRHAAVIQAIHSTPDAQLLLIGDSITNNYDKAKLPDENFQSTWKEFYEPRKALNLGFSGDSTAHVLWRLNHGEVEGLHPKVALVLIGTNNTGHYNQTAVQTEGGIDAAVAELERRLPETRILLLGILPSGISDEKTQRDADVNRYLATCYAINPRVTYLDIGSIFYKDGLLNSAIFYDPRLPQHGKPLHPDTTGQRKMAEAIEPTLAKLMNDKPMVPLDSMTDINTALIPVDKLEVDSYDWYARHQAELALEKRVRPRVVMIGDSITNFWSGEPAANRVSGALAWQQLFGDMPVINMGFGWDRTQNVLWRMREGEFQGLSPEWVVINIGTNNLSGTVNARSNNPQEIADGVMAVAQEVHRRSPASRIIVMAIFPRGARADSPLREPIKMTNARLHQRVSGEAFITYLDIGKEFLAPDGTLPAEIMPDGTHPSEAGYKVWADALTKAGIK